MKKLTGFEGKDGAHWGLHDWYPEGEKALEEVLAEHVPFDTGWYTSKKEIASARISSVNAELIRVEVSVFDDFDTEGSAAITSKSWSLEGIRGAIDKAWGMAETNRRENQAYFGYSIHQYTGERHAWVETYLVNLSDCNVPGGDYYYWFGWQYDEDGEGQNCTYPGIPEDVAESFKTFAEECNVGSLRIGEWEIQSWEKEEPAHEDPSDYAGMGWIGKDGRP